MTTDMYMELMPLHIRQQTYVYGAHAITYMTTDLYMGLMPLHISDNRHV